MRKERSAILQEPGLKLTLRLEGVSELHGDMRLAAFIEKLNALKSGLVETDHIMTGDEQQSVDYIVSDLKHSSPATVGLSPFRLFESGADPRALLEYFVDAFGIVRERRQRPPGATDKLLKVMRKLADGAGEAYSRMLLAIPGSKSVALDLEASVALEALMPAKRHAYGTIRGIVKRYHGDGERPYFSVFLPVGDQRVKCVFPPDLVNRAAAAVERTASIEGDLTYYEGETWPSQVIVRDIRVHKPDNELPTLSGLAGIAPKATGEMSAAEFIRSLRDGW